MGAAVPGPPALAWRVLACLSLVVAALVTACDDGADDELFPRVVSLGDGDIFANVVNSSLAVGPNRFMLQFEDADESPVLDADVHLRFYDLNGDEPALDSETSAQFVPIELGYIDEQAPGGPQPQSSGTSGVYVADVEFTRAGDWGVRIAVMTPERTYDEFPFQFSVRERTPEPMIGEPAPASMQATTANAPIEEIDSSYPPRPHMHDRTIADALAEKRPLVIAFATPAFCTSRTCAPVMDTVMDPLYERYGDQATFIHVEPYVLSDLRNGFVQNPVPAAREWQLQSEPWIFVVDAQGRVAAKFEGIVGVDEVEAALAGAAGS